MTTRFVTPLRTPAPAATPSVGTAAVPAATALRRACLVEARKTIDTRAAAALLALACLMPALFAFGRVLVPTPGLSLGRLASMAIGSQGTPLALIAILLVSAEFAVPTAPVTFCLERRRHLVVAAKALVLVGLVLAGAALALGLAAAATAFAPALGASVSWQSEPAAWASMVLGNLIVSASGGALALCLRNTPAPMAVLLVWPTTALLIGHLWPAAQPALRLVELPPLDALLAPRTDVLPLAVSVVVWVVLPGAIGLRRLLSCDL